MTLYKWSRVAASDATADSSINWQEGQAPSSVNDSARAMMAATAKYRDDIAGAIVTSGSSAAYALSSYQQFDSFTNMNGAMIAFTPHATNTSFGVTFNVDGLGARALRSAPSVDILPGMIVQGTPYVATYSNADGAWYLHGVFGNPYNVPIAAGMDYWGFSAPNSSFAFPIGQAVSRTTYSALFALIGAQYGGGDGSTTFNLPDKRGRASACVDNMGGTFANRITTTVNSNANLGGTGGVEANGLVTANLPPYTPSGSVSGSITGNAFANFFSVNTGSAANTYSPSTGTASPLAVTGTFSGSLSGNAQGGTSSPFTNLQPTILCNYIMRII
ncbi:phage tail protein [Bradyrhizobium sp. Ce-3]|uniref:phage tail protein n=1 Tax=Bradyrhizobium sp. Ce-3 TaxID=2913970 RepID=UPI001FC878A5|nr:tail fiber protein [Bradyrhizobium sp. Ce-3]GKQ52880.1 hypothetical protein BRSPCE3_37350 [Bradyrhizobium sp. Ce-3]